MKSAIGNSLLMSSVITIVSLVILLFVNILSYSKAYRIKNRVIEIIEKYETFESDEVNNDIKNYLHQSGYQVGGCSSKEINIINNKYNLNVDSNEILKINAKNGYKYCVVPIKLSNDEIYYKVVAFVEYNFPVINELLITPVAGETKILDRNYDNYN